MDKASEDALKDLRKEIDAIDDQLLSLFAKRMSIITRVGDLKKDNGEKFFIRSNREADMIKDLIKKSEEIGSEFPKTTIINIWRKIITSANMYEQPIKIGVHNPKNIPDYKYLLREYYSDLVPIFDFDSATNLVSEIEKGDVQIGAFILPKSEIDDNNENWWINLANNKVGLKIFAKIPFVNSDKKDDVSEIVVVGIKDAEKSKEDCSLLYVEISNDFSKSDLLASFKESGIKSKILKTAKIAQVENIDFYLVEAEGFYLEEDDVIKNLNSSKIKPYIKVLGHYPLAINL